MSKFITVEGTEGVGKTTAIATVRAIFENQALPYLMTREPGGTLLAETLRSLLLAEHEEPVHPDTELLILYAGRVQHWHQKIQPALAGNQWVVSDRFSDATYAYQGGGREINIERIKQLHHWALGNCQPDHTLLLDAPVEVGLSRIQNRAHIDRFEKETLAFFNRVRECYLSLAAAQKERFTVIDATQPKVVIQQQITETLETLIACS